MMRPLQVPFNHDFRNCLQYIHQGPVERDPEQRRACAYTSSETSEQTFANNQTEFQVTGREA
jgi:hypothetical protein